MMPLRRLREALSRGGPGDGQGADDSAPDAYALIAQRCRRQVRQRALLAAGVAAIPVPGLDWVTDVGVLVRLLPQISAAFGLTPAQIDALAPERRIAVYKAIATAGSLAVGRVVTRELVLGVLKLVGLRLTAKQAAKAVPIAGQAASALLTYGALQWVCERHIAECQALASRLQLPPPDPSPPPG